LAAFFAANPGEGFDDAINPEKGCVHIQPLQILCKESVGRFPISS
jgi:hypothetical protein